MRIGLFIDTLNIGGAEVMVTETATLLHDKGHVPVLLHFGNDYIQSFADKNGFEQFTLPNYKSYKKALLLPFFVIQTMPFIRRLRLDCWHSHLFGAIIAFSVLCRMIKMPHVGTLHDVYMIEDQPGRIWYLRLAQLMNCQLVTVSRAMQSFYLRSGVLQENQLELIPNFSHLNTALGSRETVRQRLQVDDSETVLMSVGRLVPIKRFDVLISAMAILKDKHVKTFIIGGGALQNNLQELIDRHNLGKNVKLLGERDDVEALLAAADIFTLTSESEGMSKSILEALGAGLPVVATDVGGNRELVRSGYNGHLLKNNDPEILASKIAMLAEQVETRIKLGHASTELLKNEYSATRFADRYIDVYQRQLMRYA